MQATVQQPQRAPDGAPAHCERHRPEQTTLYRLVQRHAATFFAEAEAAACADLPQFVKDELERIGFSNALFPSPWHPGHGDGCDCARHAPPSGAPVHGARGRIATRPCGWRAAGVRRALAEHALRARQGCKQALAEAGVSGGRQSRRMRAAQIAPPGGLAAPRWRLAASEPEQTHVGKFDIARGLSNRHTAAGRAATSGYDFLPAQRHMFCDVVPVRPHRSPGTP